MEREVNTEKVLAVQQQVLLHVAWMSLKQLQHAVARG